MLCGAGVMMASPASAEDGEIYVGAFGGMSWSERRTVRQTGTAHRRDDWHLDGYRDFDLPVAVEGKSQPERGSVFGAHIGYIFGNRTARVRPGIELEYGHYSTAERALLSNPATEHAINIGQGTASASADPSDYVDEHYAAGKHRFSNQARLAFDTVMVNGVMQFDTRSRWTPYLGAGAGIAFAGAKKATSYQTNPGGPLERTSDTGEVVNHFNSRDHDSTTAIAIQAKAGVKSRLTSHLSAFVEYRLLYVGATSFDLGSTQYSGHPPTDDWKMRAAPATLHNAVLGLAWHF
ncbi:MAG: outer membrane beta-barrel protein [Sphingobium sp.]